MKLYSIPLGLATTGVLLMTLFYLAPRYIDPAWATRVADYDDTDFVQERAANITLGSRLWHLGASLATIGITVGLGFALLGLREFRDLSKITTPRKKWHLFVLATVTLLAFVPAIAAWFRYTRSRGDYPVWDDTFLRLGPLMLVTLVLLALPVVIAAVIACLWGSRLPASLWLPPRNLRGWIATGLALPSAALLMFSIAASISSEPFFVPLEFSLLYLVACMRAAAASSANRSPELKQLEA